MQLPKRLQSIDVFRAITMLLMVFVNDLDPIKNVPEWIKHVGENTDGLGFADTIFPAFLFIVGLSIPIALQNRINRGESNWKLIQYIAIRSFALLLMGFFHVNLEDYNNAALLPKPIWEILITVAFFLIWMDYSAQIKVVTKRILQATGVIILIVMALLYKGGSPEEPHGLETSWWGILGLIGWSYLICALIYVLSKGRLAALVAAFAFFFLFDTALFGKWIPNLKEIRHYIWIVGGGSIPDFTMAGVIITVLYKQMISKEQYNRFWFTIILCGIGMVVLGFITRPYGGISKIKGTPSWTGICTGISILFFALMIWLVDVKHKQQWFKIIMPAGTATLTCYLIPYLLYSLYKLFNFTFPDILNEGLGGLLRSIAVAFIVVFIAGWLEKKHMKLKI